MVGSDERDVGEVVLNNRDGLSAEPDGVDELDHVRFELAYREGCVSARRRRESSADLRSFLMNLGLIKLRASPLYTPSNGIPFVPTTSCPAYESWSDQKSATPSMPAPRRREPTMPLSGPRSSASCPSD